MAISYSEPPGKAIKMDLVAMNFNRPLSDTKTQIVNSNKPLLLVHIETSKKHEENKSQLIICVEERSQQLPKDGKRILTTEVAAYRNQDKVKSLLGLLGVYEVLTLVLSDEDQLKQYLENPPKGIDPRMWRQA